MHIPNSMLYSVLVKVVDFVICDMTREVDRAPEPSKEDMNINDDEL